MEFYYLWRTGSSVLVQINVINPLKAEPGFCSFNINACQCIDLYMENKTLDILQNLENHFQILPNPSWIQPNACTRIIYAFSGKRVNKNSVNNQQERR